MASVRKLADRLDARWNLSIGASIRGPLVVTSINAVEPPTVTVQLDGGEIDLRYLDSYTPVTNDNDVWAIMQGTDGIVIGKLA